MVKPDESIVDCNGGKVLYISDDLKKFGFNILFFISLYGIFGIYKKPTKLKAHLTKFAELLLPFRHLSTL